jgi:hypothetical protein
MSSTFCGSRHVRLHLQCRHRQDDSFRGGGGRPEMAEEMLLVARKPQPLALNVLAQAA